MRAILAVSARPPGAAPPPDPALPYLPGATVHQHDGGWVALTPGDGDDPPDPARPGAFTVRLTRAARGRTGDLDTTRLAALLGDGGQVDREVLSTVLPPFAAAHRAGRSAPVVLAGDWLGLRQLFWWQGTGVAAVATSALALAALAGARLDPAGLGAQSLLGWQVGLGTVFTGVHKLPPAAVAALHDGEVRIHRYAPATLPPDPGAPPVPAVVAEMAGILREIHDSYLADHPDAVLQLSGGQDSRLQLCAVPPPRRRGLRAFTLDTHGGAEARVATRLAAECELAHEVIWLDDRPPVDAPTGFAAAVAAASALDAMASPLAEAPLRLIEADLAQGHRLVGTGGETARGFYYPGQPRRATTSPARIARLADWRLFSNEAVASEALDPDFLRDSRAATLRMVSACFAGYHADWLRATDEFYLWQRVQRWAGAHDTTAAVARHTVNSLLDRRFLQLALTPPPAEKRASRLTGRLLRQLDPALAAIPLDSGLVPARLATPLRGAPALARVTAGKAARKVWQRLAGGRRAQLGAAQLSRLVVDHWRAAPELLAPVRRTGLVRDDWLDELLAGRRDAGAATVAFLVNLSVAAPVAGCRLSDS